MAAMLGAAVTFGSKAMHGKVNLRFTFLFSLPNINEFPFLSMSKHVLRQNIGEGRRLFFWGGGLVLGRFLAIHTCGIRGRRGHS